MRETAERGGMRTFVHGLMDAADRCFPAVPPGPDRQARVDALQARLTGAVHKWRAVAERRCWRRWWENVRARRWQVGSEQAAVTFYHQRARRRGLKALRDLARAANATRAALWHRQRTAVRRWRGESRWGLRARRAGERGRLNCMRRGLGQWRASVREWKARRQNEAQAIAHCDRRRVGGALRKW